LSQHASIIGGIAQLTVRRRAPARGEHVQVTAANPTVANFDVHIIFCPFLGLKLAPLHVALRRRLVDAEPSFEL
jgi:hypothetical protein